MEDTTAPEHGSGSVVLPEAEYWKLRVQALEHRALVDSVRASEERMNAAFTRLGLDLKRSYRLDDATCTAVVTG